MVLGLFRERCPARAIRIDWARMEFSAVTDRFAAAAKTIPVNTVTIAFGVLLQIPVKGMFGCKIYKERCTGFAESEVIVIANDISIHCRLDARFLQGPLLCEKRVCG